MHRWLSYWTRHQREKQLTKDILTEFSMLTFFLSFTQKHVLFRFSINTEDNNIYIFSKSTSN